MEQIIPSLRFRLVWQETSRTTTKNSKTGKDKIDVHRHAPVRSPISVEIDEVLDLLDYCVSHNEKHKDIKAHIEVLRVEMKE